MTKRRNDCPGSVFAKDAKAPQYLPGNGKPGPGNTQHHDYPVSQPTTVFATLGHMHMLGRSTKVELNPGAPDFDNQKFLQLSSPVDVKPGDTPLITPVTT